MCNRFEGGGACQKRSTLRMFAYSLLAVLLSIPLGLHAQQYSGTIVGTVTDSTGAVIPGAIVTVINTGTGESVHQTSGSRGEFTFAQLPIGTYEVRVKQGNFKEFIETNVVVHTSTNTEVAAVLQVGSQTQTVTVQADAVQVQTTSAEVGEVVSGTQVRELPLNGENFVELTQLSPGVSAAAGSNFQGKGLDGGVNFSVNGNPYNMNLFLVDGVNNNDVGSNRTILIYPSTDAIAEFKMLRNSFGPEYGQAAGAIISITTRSGENQIHGGFFYSGRNDALDANDWFSNDDHLPRGEERRDDYGYNISGPAIKDKLWGWWNQEWDKEINAFPFQTCVPTQAEEGGNFAGAQTGTNSSGQGIDQCGAVIPTIPVADQAAGNPLAIANPDAGGLLIPKFYPAPTQATVNSAGYNWLESQRNKLNWSEWNVRGDWQINHANRGTLRWTQDSWSNPGPANATSSGYWGVGELPTITTDWSQPGKSVMGKVTTTFSSTMVNDAEFGFGQNRIITTLAGTEAATVPELQAAYPPSWPASLKQKDEYFGGWGGLNPYGSYEEYASMWNLAPYGNHEDLYAAQDNLSKVWGNHTIKAGFEYGNNEKVESSGNGADRPTLPTIVYCETVGGVNVLGPGLPACANTNNPIATLLIPGTGSTPQEFTVGEGSIDGIADVHWHDFEPYLGDSWKITRNVTIDFGFRYSLLREPYGGPDGGNTNPAYDSGANYPHQWSNWQRAYWSAAEATANPADVCNGMLIQPGSNSCANQNKFLQSLGVPLTFSNGTNGPNDALVEQNNHSIAPRFGLAWDVRGDGKTAVRIGGGQFFTREEVGLAEELAHTAPFEISATTNRSIDTPTPFSSAVPSVSIAGSKTTNGHIPNSWQWNVTIEQELARNTTLQVGYVGNEGEHLTDMNDVNFIQPTNWLQSTFAPNTTTFNSYRPAFNFGEIGGFNRGGHSSYNSLQVLFRAQTGNFSTFQAAYTWSHSIANVELDNASGSLNQQAITNQANPSLDKGNSEINRPNIFVANEVFFLPKFASHGQLVQNTLGGWEANSIISAAEGNSLTVYTTSVGGGCTEYAGGICTPAGTSFLGELVGTGYSGNQRPLTTASSCTAGRSGPIMLNESHFTLQGYTLGTFPSNIESRGTCFGAPNTNVDGQLAKNWTFKEKYRLKFSMDFFDLFNHPNFNSSNLNSGGATYSPTTGVFCGGTTAPVISGGNSPYTGAPCSPTNNVITSATTPTSGFGSAGSVNVADGNRQLQYTLKFTF
jgi:hypothetical protein